MRGAVLAAALAVVAGAPAWGATYFVRPDGGQTCSDAFTGLDPAQPWCTPPGTRTSTDAGWLRDGWGNVTRAAPIQCGDAILLCGGTTHGRNANGGNDVGGIRIDDGSDRANAAPDVPLEGFYTRGCPAGTPITIRLAVPGEWPGRPDCEAGSFVMDGTGITPPGGTYFGDVHALVTIEDIDTLHLLGASSDREIVVRNAEGGPGFRWANGIVVSTDREPVIRRTWLRHVRLQGHQHVALAYGGGGDGVQDFLFQDIVAEDNGAGCFDNGLNADQSTGNGALYRTTCTRSGRSVEGTGNSSEGYWGSAAGRVGSGLRVVWIIDADSFDNGMAGFDYGALSNTNVTQDWITSVRNLRMWNNATRPVAVKANWRMSGDGDNTPPDVRLFVSRCLLSRPDAAGAGGVNAESGHDGGDIQWWHCVLWGGGTTQLFYNRSSGEVGLYDSIVARGTDPPILSFNSAAGTPLDPPFHSDGNIYRSVDGDDERLTDFEFRCTAQGGAPPCRSNADCAAGVCQYVFVESGLTYSDAAAGRVSWIGPGDRAARASNDPRFEIRPACGPPAWNFAACDDFPIASDSAAIDAGRCFFRAANAATNGTSVTVQPSAPGLEDPRIAFYAPDSFYQPAAAGIPADPIQVGSCRTTVVSLDATTVGLGSPCSWAADDCVHFPYEGAAPDAGYREFGAPEPPPGGGGPCDDGDPCTTDTLAATGCTYAERVGLADVACVCDRNLPPDCVGQTIPRSIAVRQRRACRRVVRALDRKPELQRRRAHAAARGWNEARRRLGRRNVIAALSPACIGGLEIALRDAAERAGRFTGRPVGR